jgi:hypothetical protein
VSAHFGCAGGSHSLMVVPHLYNVASEACALRYMLARCGTCSHLSSLVSPAWNYRACCVTACWLLLEREKVKNGNIRRQRTKIETGNLLVFTPHGLRYCVVIPGSHIGIAGATARVVEMDCAFHSRQTSLDTTVYTSVV